MAARASIALREGRVVGGEIDALTGDPTESGGGAEAVAGRADQGIILAYEEGKGKGEEEEGSRPISLGLEEDGESGSRGVEETAKKKKI